MNRGEALALFAVLLCGLLLVRVALAHSSASYGLFWWTADAGGATFSTGGEYTLGATTGQPDANVLHGGEYTLVGGFWPGGETFREPHGVYLPLVIRRH
jgi:hypothetical protein